MGIDQSEAKRRRQADSTKYSSKQPIAAIEKRVIDSEQFAHLPPSAVVVLLLLSRNLEKGRNGHVFLSLDDAERHGINKKTLYRQLKTLTARGFIFPTKRGGNGQCGTYALTWLPLSKDTAGLHPEGFRLCAWRDRNFTMRKIVGVKMSPSRGQKYPSAPDLGDKNTPSLGDKFTHIEVHTNSHRIGGDLAGSHAATTARSGAWIPGYLERLADAGLAGAQCFQIPTGMLQ